MQVGAVGVVYQPSVREVRSDVTQGRGQKVRRRGLAVGARNHGDSLASKELGQGIGVELEHHLAADRGPCSAAVPVERRLPRRGPASVAALRRAVAIDMALMGVGRVVGHRTSATIVPRSGFSFVCLQVG